MIIFIFRGDCMTFVTWNVNGLNACIRKGFIKFFDKVKADFFCVQETKLNEDIAEFKPKDYKKYYNFSDKSGYSGTAVFTKHEPLNIVLGMRSPDFDKEGRVITLEYSNFYIVNVYIPTSQSGHIREDYRFNWEEEFKEYLRALSNDKSIIICGDFNATHLEIDSKIPRSLTTRGFVDNDRVGFCELLENVNLIDTYRVLYPTKKDVYTWWPYPRDKRIINAGARLDYFLISEHLRDTIKSVPVYSDVEGSDHCPIGLEMDI